MCSFLRRLVQQVIDEGRYADEYIGFEFADVADVAFCAHHPATAGTHGHETGGCSRVMGEPEREMWREVKGVEQSVLGPCGANFNEAASGRGQAAEIALAKEKRRGFRAAAGGEGGEDRAELGFEILRHPFATADEDAQDRAEASGQHLLVRNQDEVPE